MEFHGDKKKYKKMILGGLPAAIVIFFIAIATQGTEFSFFSVFLFALGGAAAGGFVGAPTVYLLGPDRKVVLTKEEFQLVEGKRPKVAEYSDIQNVKRLKNSIVIKKNKGKILINGVHGYPLDEIQKSLEKQLTELKVANR